jgi:hypothetical protein
MLCVSTFDALAWTLQFARRLSQFCGTYKTRVKIIREVSTVKFKYVLMYYLLVFVISAVGFGFMGVALADTDRERVGQAKIPQDGSRSDRSEFAPDTLKERWVAKTDVDVEAKSRTLALMRRLSVSLQEIQSAYKQAYSRGNIRDWVPYMHARRMFAHTQKLYNSERSALRKHDSKLADELDISLRDVEQILTKKSHPQQMGYITHQLMQRVYLLDPSMQSVYLSEYKKTLEKLKSYFVVSGKAGQYNVGLLLRRPQAFFRWDEVQRRDVRTEIAPSDKTIATVGVFIWDNDTGIPLSGTDVSIEILDPESKKQLSSQRLFLMWDGYPLYVGHIAIPGKDKRKDIILQVSISPFPVTRTSYSRQLLLQGGVATFPASLRDNNLSFAKSPKASTAPISANLPPGLDIMRAIAAVGGQIQHNGPYRIGLALLPPEPIWHWKNGAVMPVKLNAWYNTRIVAFVQDIRSGLLIPGARIQMYLYWRDAKGDIHRRNVWLEPMFDGFFGYQAIFRLQRINYDIRARIDPALHATYGTRLLPSYSLSIEDFSPDFLQPTQK